MSNGRIEDWKDLKFGMFIHWGLYSMLGTGCWSMFTKAIDKDEYRKLADKFTAEKFDAEKLAELAKKAGMKYMVMGSRHHDGFSLWDSESSYENFTSMNSAAKRDFVKEYTDACRNAGLKVGLYYSLLDWRFPGYFLPRMYKKNADELREQYHNQVKELTTNYGKIDILWYDGGEDYWLCHGINLHDVEATQLRSDNFRKNPQIHNFWKSEELHTEIRKHTPDIVINNRYGLRDNDGFLTPEAKVGEFNIEKPWESCMCLNGHWGWRPNLQPLSLRELISMLVMVVTGGGNLLLNIGPKGDGSLEEAEVRRLLEVGEWMDKYGESIYGTRGGPLVNGEEWGGTVWKDNKLYIHVINWRNDFIKIPKSDSAIKKVYSLTTDSVEFEEEENIYKLSVSAEARNDIDTIIVVEYDKKVDEITFNVELKSFLQDKQDLDGSALIVEDM